MRQLQNRQPRNKRNKSSFFSRRLHSTDLLCKCLFERIQEPKEERKEKEAGSTDLVFSETILFLAWTGSGVATVRQLRLNEH